jgi:hypothetical protein
MSTARRSVHSPKVYQGQPEGRVNLYNQTYVGFVKAVDDETYMGRLRVWIPEIHPNTSTSSTDADNAENWITVNYCSPFAGATSIAGNVKDGKEYKESQMSYGWWAVPPHVGNEVVVIFANGDPTRGLWIGCLFQQRMNHMVPGLASSASHQEGEDGINPPTVEYNKKDESQAVSDDPMRPRFDPLHDGFLAQGLYTDPQRGPSDSSARRNVSVNTNESGAAVASVEASHVYGFSTPRGNTVHVDDNPENEFIRLRTRSGAQVLINETVGYVYMISKNGNSWFEISDEGINAFTTRTFNVRAMQGTNLHTEGNTTINSVGGTNMTGSTGSFQVAGDLDIVVPGSFRVSTAGSIHLNSMGDINLTSAGNSSVLSSGTLALQSSGALGVTSSGQLFLNGSKVNTNGGAGPAATQAEGATAPEPESHHDIEVNQAAGYPDMATGSTVGVLPTHEPWPGHPRSETPPDDIAPNPNTSGSQLESAPNVPTPEGGADNEDGTTPPPPDGEDRGWMYPISGRITSRSGKIRTKSGGGTRPHKGVDIAAPIGTPVYAAKSGVVVDTFQGRFGTRTTRRTGGSGGQGSGYGTALCIKHDNGLVTLYAHMNSLNVRVGQSVQQGQVVGTSGRTGIVNSQPHLHFEILRNRYMGQWLVVHSFLPKCGREGGTIVGRERT